nr:MAG TPA: hypothetical protein [Caudoviricetes sp.]
MTISIGITGISIVLMMYGAAQVTHLCMLKVKVHGQ